MEDKEPARKQMRIPALIICHNCFIAMATIYENQAQRSGPISSYHV
jgi:hypothetical protein